MSKKCPRCKSIVVDYEDYVGGTLFYKCQTCGYRGSDFEKQTVFDKITASEEALAEKLVHLIMCEEDTSLRGWTSNVVESVFETYEEAIAATVAELRKEYKKDDSGRN